jgi:F-type H+-transporting ATPase subunit b
MSVAANLQALATVFVQAEYDIDDDGYVTSKHPILPEPAELIYGGLASIIVFALLFWKGWPLAKKAMHARTQRIQDELDAASAAKAAAEQDATKIRQALGDIESERARLLADADAQAEALLADGRVRLEQEVADLEARAEADLAAAASRSGDELRAEIARLASAAADRVVARSLDDSIQQELVEHYIARVGVGAPA